MNTATSADEVRDDLSAEVRTRLGQLDIILKHLENAIDVIAPDSQELERTNAWTQENYPAVERGEISIEQWIDGTRLPCQVELQDFIDAWESINLFTESFYFFAWRLMVALNVNRRNRFLGLHEIKAKGVSRVRNHLLEHPERHGQNFKQFLTLTNSGPVLRTAEVAIKSDTGKVMPTGSSVDEGLYVTAEKFRDELQKGFDQAIKSLSSQ